MAGALDIGTLQGGVEFEDKVSTTLDVLLKKTEGLEAAFGGLDSGVKETAQGFLIAEGAMKVLERAFDIGIRLVKDFTTEGAAIADVADNFNHITEAAGRTGETLLGALRDGTHNTIDDFNLMKIANQDLAAGLNLTDEQFHRMAEGANALAQATGTDVADALDRVNDALIKGQARGVQSLTGVIDMEAAQKAFADSLGTTVERLTDEEKLQANRAAILDAVTAATGRLGEQTDGVDEILAQISTAWKNFYDNLISGVAASPKVIQAFEDIKTTLIAAFGGDSQSLVQTFVGWVETIAEKVSEYLPKVLDWFGRVKEGAIALWDGAVEAWKTYGPTVLSALETVVEWVKKVYDTTMNTWNALPDWLKTVAEKSAATAVGLYALDAAGSAVGLSFSDLIGYAGNLTTTLTGLPQILGRVSAAFAELAVLKGVLDFSSFADARASINLVAESIGGMIGPLGMAAAYAAALYAAFELGKWQPVSDFFQDLGLRIMGYTEAERASMIEQDHLTQKMAEANSTQKQGTDIAAQMEEIQKKIAAAMANATHATEGNAGAVKQHTEAVRMSNDELKKYKEAWEAIDNVGKNAQATIDQLDGKVVEAVRYYYDAGVAMDKLKTAYMLTDEQASALKDTFDAQNKKLADQKALADATAAAWANLNALGGDQDKIIRGIGDRVKMDIERYYDLGASVSDLAKAYKLTEEQIKAVIAARDREKQATDAQTGANAQNAQSLSNQLNMYRALNGELMTYEEHRKSLQQGNSITYDLSTQGGLDYYRSMNTAATFGTHSDQEIITAAKQGMTLQQMIQKGWINPYGGFTAFADGGIVTKPTYGVFGEAGPEAVIPLDQMGGLGGTVNNTFYVNGTGQEVANTVASHIMTQLKLRRRFGAA